MANKHKRKNRKQHSAGIRYPGTLLSGLVAVSCLALCYLWIGGRCEALGREIKELERTHGEAVQRLGIEQAKWARMYTLDGVQSALRRFDTEMKLPRRDQLVYIRRIRLDGERETDGQAIQLARLTEARIE
jgi:hypothetical protein